MSRISMLLALLAAAPAFGQARLPVAFERSPDQPVDKSYTARIRETTTDPRFNSPLTDYLPASAAVPTPAAALGDVAGAPDMLPYVIDIHRYFRLLAEASPRVEVSVIGTSEEGREMLAVAVSSEANLARRQENDRLLAQLADPRALDLDEARAREITARAIPVYYITGAIHSPETGSPTALMELAYRLAVDESPYIRAIRDNVIVLLTPVVEVDGRDRMVDLYNWHKAHPGRNYPDLYYWGRYVAHDNNRDALTLTLNLTRAVLDTFVGWHAQVLHDLHESVPFLYDNTIGDGPYNAWLDPILTNEWQLMGWYNVAEMTRFGMPGVFAHGDFDTWSPAYLMFLAATHNGVSRLYETFGNAGADTVERTLDPDEYNRTWYRQNPPLPRVTWSQRNNNNYQQTGLLVSLAYFAENRETFLRNFFMKAKRSIEKPANEGPAAYVLPADEPRRWARGQLLEILALQHCEISRLDGPADVALEAPANEEGGTEAATRRFPAGSFVIRMDQPYSRIADALLDHQYWSPDDPQKNPYDDTGWTLGELFDVEVVRVTDRGLLEAPMSLVADPVSAAPPGEGRGDVFLVDRAAAGAALASLRYRLGGAAVDVAAEDLEADGRELGAGALIVSGAEPEAVSEAARAAGVPVRATGRTPDVARHPVGSPRVALLHTWIDTQTEGWWRQALDRLEVPYDYISTQDVAADPELAGRYDVILFPPIGWGDPQRIVEGLPLWGEPMPWQTSELTPNLGRIDATEDVRPGLGFAGLANLRRFVQRGGLLVAVEDTARLLIDQGLAPGVRVADDDGLRVQGSVLRARFVDRSSPVSWGYDETLAIYSASGLSFEVSSLAQGGRLEEPPTRPTGRGGAEEHDVPQGRPFERPPEPPEARPWEAVPLSEEQMRNDPYVIPQGQRPRVILRFADEEELLVSGLLDGGDRLAGRPAVVDVPLGDGHVLLFAINPIWRGETVGSYPLVLNALLHHDHLDLGRR
ncbi:MAG: M14 family zinc carboxypeptidase [Thermoanaerobaculia bacterium]